MSDHEGLVQDQLLYIESLEAERNALAEHLERYRAAYVKLTNRVEFADNGEGCYVADGELMHEFDAIAEDSPTTSLARLIAEKQAEALQELYNQCQGAGMIRRGALLDKAIELQEEVELAGRKA